MSLDFEEALYILSEIDENSLSAEQMRRIQDELRRFEPLGKNPLSKIMFQTLFDLRNELFEMKRGEYTAGYARALKKTKVWYPKLTSEEFMEMMTNCVKGARLTPHYCGWNESGTIYSGWDNMWRNAQRIERLADTYHNAVTTGNFRRPAINKTGKGGKETTVQMVKSDPAAYFENKAATDMLQILGETQRTQISG